MRKHGVAIRSMPETVALALLAVMAVGCAGPPAKPVSPSVLPTLAGRWNVLFETRDAQPLFAACIHLRELGDGRHLSQQSQGIKATLFDGSRRPR